MKSLDRRAAAKECADTFIPADATRPPRSVRRREWAAVPRRFRDMAPRPRVDWLPARARAELNAQLTKRNDLDRAMAEARGLAADDPRCARFQGPKYRKALDVQVRANARAGV